MRICKVCLNEVKTDSSMESRRKRMYNCETCLTFREVFEIDADKIEVVRGKKVAYKNNKIIDWIGRGKGI